MIQFIINENLPALLEYSVSNIILCFHLESRSSSLASWFMASWVAYMYDIVCIYMHTYTSCSSSESYHCSYISQYYKQYTVPVLWIGGTMYSGSVYHIFVYCIYQYNSTVAFALSQLLTVVEQSQVQYSSTWTREACTPHVSRLLNYRQKAESEGRPVEGWRVPVPSDDCSCRWRQILK